MKDWICTDSDTSQYCRKINDYSYEFIEIREAISEYVVCTVSIDIRDYSLDELWNYCSGYYCSYEQMVEQYGFREAIRIIAECVFEQMGYDEMEYNFIQDSFDKAIKFVHKYIHKSIV